MQALEEQVQRGQRFAQTTTIPAPVKGWNTIDPLAAMDPQYAVQLDNWIPQPNYIEARSGSAAWATGLPGAPNSLIPYVAGGVAKLFAAAGAGIYDVTAQGAVGAAAVAISDSTNWVTQSFETLAGLYITCCNGADPTQYFDGTTWTASAITGVDPTTLCGVTAYQARLWYIQKNTMSAWYLTPGGITGAATQFNVGTEVQRGGSLVAIGTWSLDAGNGPAEYLVMLTDQGEAIVYQGTDPSQSSTFSKVGTYRIPKPIGFKCLLKYAGDMLVLTQQGVYPLSKALLAATVDRQSALTYTISSQFATDYASAKTSIGWEMALLTEANLLFANVPKGDPAGANAQYVMNTITGAWCRFIGLDAVSFCDFNGELFFGQRNPMSGSYQVWQGLTGAADGAADIDTTVLTAYNYLNQNVGQKQIKLVRPTFQVNDNIALFMAISMDFVPLAESDFMEIDFSVNVGGLWDVGLWDQARWGAALFNPLQWCSPIAPVGFCAAIGLQTSTSSSTIRIASFDIAYEDGTGIL
jgi:hypothetical protein